jgi:hypothetical protein
MGTNIETYANFLFIQEEIRHFEQDLKECHEPEEILKIRRVLKRLESIQEDLLALLKIRQNDILNDKDTD